MQTFSGAAGTAFTCDLPPADDRPNTDSIACLGRWNMTLPGQHAFWDRYCLAVCHLRDMPCLTPARKESPEMTHEITVFAIDPEFPQENFEKGGISPLEPPNHVCQFVANSDKQAYEVAWSMVVRLVNGLEFPEPSGIMGARDRFKESVRYFLSNP